MQRPKAWRDSSEPGLTSVKGESLGLCLGDCDVLPLRAGCFGLPISWVPSFLLLTPSHTHLSFVSALTKLMPFHFLFQKQHIFIFGPFLSFSKRQGECGSKTWGQKMGVARRGKLLYLSTQAWSNLSKFWE